MEIFCSPQWVVSMSRVREAAGAASSLDISSSLVWSPSTIATSSVRVLCFRVCCRTNCAQCRQGRFTFIYEYRGVCARCRLKLERWRARPGSCCILPAAQAFLATTPDRGTDSLGCRDIIKDTDTGNCERAIELRSCLRNGVAPHHRSSSCLAFIGAGSSAQGAAAAHRAIGTAAAKDGRRACRTRCAAVIEADSERSGTPEHDQAIAEGRVASTGILGATNCSEGSCRSRCIRRACRAACCCRDICVFVPANFQQSCEFQ